MAQKRMFSNDVVSNDNFIEMPDSSQNLYFHLAMNADDDGFISNYKSIMRMLGKKDDDLKVLIAKSFIIPFENGLLVIRHWRLNNYIQKDRYKETIYKNEKAQLNLDNNNVYNLDTNCIHSIDKISIDKIRLEESIAHGEFKKVKLTLEEFEKLNERLGERLTKKYIQDLDSYIASKGKRYSSHYATILSWYNRDNKANTLPEWFNKEIKEDKLTKEEEEKLKESLKEYEEE